MKIAEVVYEAAWAKRNLATIVFKEQLEKDLIEARTLPSGKQLQAVIAAADKYDDACQPAVEEWQRDLGIIDAR